MTNKLLPSCQLRLVKVVDNSMTHARTWTYDNGRSLTLFEDGRVAWFDNNSKPHATDHPAVIERNGSTMWYRHGKLHRLVFPAIVRSARYSIPQWYVRGGCVDPDQYGWGGPIVVDCEYIDYGSLLACAGLIEYNDRKCPWPSVVYTVSRRGEPR